VREKEEAVAMKGEEGRLAAKPKWVSACLSSIGSQG